MSITVNGQNEGYVSENSESDWLLGWSGNTAPVTITHTGFECSDGTHGVISSGYNYNTATGSTSMGGTIYTNCGQYDSMLRAVVGYGAPPTTYEYSNWFYSLSATDTLLLTNPVDFETVSSTFHFTGAINSSDVLGVTVKIHKIGGFTSSSIFYANWFTNDATASTFDIIYTLPGGMYEANAILIGRSSGGDPISDWTATTTFQVASDYLQGGTQSMDVECETPSGITDVGGGIYWAGCKLFKPSLSIQDKMADLWVLFKSIFPFNWFFTAYDSLRAASITSTSYPSVVLSVGPLGTYILSTSSYNTIIPQSITTNLRTWGSYALWVLFTIWIIYEIKRFI